MLDNCDSNHDNRKKSKIKKTSKFKINRRKSDTNSN